MSDPDQGLQSGRTQRWDRVPELGGPSVPGRPPVPPRRVAEPAAVARDQHAEPATAWHAPAPVTTVVPQQHPDPIWDAADSADDGEWAFAWEDDDEWDDEPVRQRDPLWRLLVRGAGELLVTAGLVVLLFVVYEVYVTDLLNDRTQGNLAEQIRDQWDQASAAPENLVAPAVGEPLAILHVPRLGEDYSRVVLEGVSEEQLAEGPGHYIGTALPGQQGNLAIAGHRVGKGSPFLDTDKLVPGDPIVVETAQNWYVYRVLGDAATGDYTTDASGIPGQQIVKPDDVSVIAPTPGAAGAAPSGAYLTLTTCHPKYSAKQRLIVHAALDGDPVSKAEFPDGPPALTEG
ncbi:Putative Sortase protein (surface protein transpeptidase) [Modestobacter italicus]|uniref:Sortase protein (Surface protein transpeptidase) n=1 Tax=Modestobacter italicus (strain DSM 44449 / CECT 9708 / BC 501) TaxID=2732864 RepID=I4EQX6_MODI5|nr:class E sortase [Modestobacter marinus]CCH85789.1 Putative Sortase protein (surface protein transpeptidase) [Modestobacter marinus]